MVMEGLVPCVKSGPSSSQAWQSLLVLPSPLTPILRQHSMQRRTPVKPHRRGRLILLPAFTAFSLSIVPLYLSVSLPFPASFLPGKYHSNT